MTDQPYPPAPPVPPRPEESPRQDPGQVAPYTNLVPPKPTADNQTYVPAQQYIPPQQFGYPTQPQQQPAQTGNTLEPIDPNSVYPTPTAESQYPTDYQMQQALNIRQHTYEQPYGQQLYGQKPYEPPQTQYQQPLPPQGGQPGYQIPVQPADPSTQPLPPTPGQQPTQPSMTPPAPTQQPPHTGQQAPTSQWQQPVGQYQQPGQSAQPSQPTYQQPGASQYNPYQSLQQQAYPVSNQAPEKNKFGLYLTLAILEVLFCGGVFAIPAIVYAAMMNTSYNSGNRFLYQRNRRTCRMWLIIALVIGIIANALYGFILFSDFGSSSYSGYY